MRMLQKLDLEIVFRKGETESSKCKHTVYKHRLNTDSRDEMWIGEYRGLRINCGDETRI